MNLIEKHKESLYLIGAVSLSVFFSQQVFFFLFHVPLFLILKKQGKSRFGVAVAVFFAVKLFFIWFEVNAHQDPKVRDYLLKLSLIGLGNLVFFLAGIYVALGGVMKNHRLALRFLLLAVCAAVVFLPVFTVWFGEEEFKQEWIALFQNLFDEFSQSPSGEDPLLIFGEQEIELFLRICVFSYFILLLFYWFVLEIFSSVIEKRPAYRLRSFKTPGIFLWPAMLLWTFMLAGIFIPLGYAEYPIWNFGLIMLFFYGLQGLAILIFILKRYNISYPIRLVILLAVGLLALQSTASFYTTMIAVFALPCLGLAETWINFRGTKGEINENNT